ncbi:MAG: EamA family transporter [Gammaproteobacteria bacterium]|nr:EamA family transporter [Gammaproteobacteria bacterium]
MSAAHAGRSRPRARLLAAFAFVYLFWGSSYLASRIGVLRLPPLLFAGARFIIAGLIMLLIGALLGVRLRPAGHEWRDLAVLSLLAFVISNGLSIWALQWLPSNQASLLTVSAPRWIVLLGALGSRGQRPGRRDLAGLLLGFLGTALVIRPTGAAGLDSDLLPAGAVLLACLAWAVATIYLRNVGPRIAVQALIGWQMLLGGGGLALLGAARGEAALWQFSWAGTLALAYLIVFASCLAHTAYAWLALRTSPTSLGTYAYVNPLIATVLGWWILDERLTPLQLTGMPIVLGGVLLINWPFRRRSSPWRP